jgi:hypothetical protein
MIDKINKAVEDIKEDIEEDVYNAIQMKKLKINVNDLDEFLTNLKEDIEFIPDEKDLENLIKQGVGTVNYVTPTINEVNNQQSQPQPQQTIDPVDIALHNGYQPTQPMQPVPQPMAIQPQQQAYDPVNAVLMRGY